jgi:hypothetical protein
LAKRLKAREKYGRFYRLVLSGVKEAGMKGCADARRHWMFFWFLVSRRLKK